MSVLLIFAIMVSAYLTTARAEGPVMLMTGNALLAYCEGDFQDKTLCLGYIEGVADFFSFSRQGAGLAPCIPADVGLSSGRVLR
jgi:hypothetical protein